jgi:hypothetical protein
MPSMVSKPIRATNCAIRPKTATGARNIAHFTIFIEIDNKASIRSRNGATRAR